MEKRNASNNVIYGDWAQGTNNMLISSVQSPSYFKRYANVSKSNKIFLTFFNLTLFSRQEEDVNFEFVACDFELLLIA